MSEILKLNDTARALALELTILTGELWTARPDTSDYNQRPHVDSPSACLFLYQEYRTNRLSIRASAPADMREMKTGETITCDSARKMEAIARDIKSRLLDHARAHLTESRAYHTQKTKEENKEKLTIQLLKKYLPHEWHNHSRGAPSLTNEYTSNPVKINAEINGYHDTVELKINLRLSEALQLLKQLTAANV